MISEVLTKREVIYLFFSFTSPELHILQCDNMKSIGEAVGISTVLHREHFE